MGGFVRFRPPARGTMGARKRPLGGASTPLIQGASPIRIGDRLMTDYAPPTEGVTTPPRITLGMVGYDRHRVSCSDCDYVEVFDGAEAAIAAYRDHDCHVLTPDGWCAVHSDSRGPAYCIADVRWRS